MWEQGFPEDRMSIIYLDNSATTELSEPVKAAMREAMELWGNPSSLHALGNTAHEAVEAARREIAVSFGIRRPEPGNVIFTSCGSEADNLALFGTAFAKQRRRGGRIISTDSEHPGAENVLQALEKQGFDVVRIPTLHGELDWERYRAALNEKTFLVSMMTVNNETGAAYDIGRAFRMAKENNPDIVTHTDAVQGYLKCPMNPKTLCADLITVSAHKIHGPKGVGALIVSPDALRRRDLVPVLLGGGQEYGFRSGTENTVGIVGFGAAAKEGFAHLEENIAHMKALRELTEQKLASLPVRMNLPSGMRAPHILNITLPEIRSETMLHALSERGIFISNGSACSSHSHHPSRALASFGLTEQEIECSIRVSFSERNTVEEVGMFTAALEEAIGRLVRIRR